MSSASLAAIHTPIHLCATQPLNNPDSMTVRLVRACVTRPIGAVVTLVASAAFAAPISAQDSLLVRATEAPPNAVWLDTLDLSTWQQRRQRPRPKLSLRGRPITMNGVLYPHGVGTLTIN